MPASAIGSWAERHLHSVFTARPRIPTGGAQQRSHDQGMDLLAVAIALLAFAALLGALEALDRV
jgi:hypothetical protein